MRTTFIVLFLLGVLFLPHRKLWREEWRGITMLYLISFGMIMKMVH